jgi:hypothetical protein
MYWNLQRYRHDYTPGILYTNNLNQTWLIVAVDLDLENVTYIYTFGDSMWINTVNMSSLDVTMNLSGVRSFATFVGS